MKKSKRIFTILAVIVLGICLLCSLFLKSDEAEPTTPPTTAATETDIPATEDPDAPILPTSEVPWKAETYTPAENVRINQVEKDPNEVIRAYEPIGPDDPEYLEFGSDTLATIEGKVFRNDKTISIDIFDEFTGDTMTFTFGYITGECNRFLYLNPRYEQGEEDKYYYGFQFSPMLSNGGSVITLPQEFATEEERKEYRKEASNFTCQRALDENEVANYCDPTHPGTVWFTQTPIEGDVWLDCRVYTLSGDLLATLRLTIAKDADGTYSIVNLENKNLLQTYEEEDAQFSKDELAYIYEHARDVILDTEKIGVAIDSSNMDLSIERCIMEYRDQYTGMYYSYFVPKEKPPVLVYASSYDYDDEPMVAVSVRQYGMMPTAVTLYFRIVKAPTAEEHGIYEYLGRDFLLYSTREALASQGCPPY